jgi:hypothetical protein
MIGPHVASTFATLIHCNRHGTFISYLDVYARVMLLCQHGASHLGKSLRRPIVNTMNSEGAAIIPSLPIESMRTARTLAQGARAM